MDQTRKKKILNMQTLLEQEQSKPFFQGGLGNLFYYIVQNDFYVYYNNNNTVKVENFEGWNFFAHFAQHEKLKMRK